MLTDEQRSKSLRTTILSLAFTTLTLILTIATTAFAARVTNHLASSNSTGTLDSWSCKWGQGVTNPTTPSPSAAPSPTNTNNDNNNESVSASRTEVFSTICSTGSAAFDVLVLALVVQVVGVAVAGWSFVVAKRLGRAERGRRAWGSKVELV